MNSTQGVTLKVTEFDLGYPKYPSDIPMTSPFITTMCTEVGFRNKAAGITAVNWLLLTMVVCNHVPVSCRLPFVVQNAVLHLNIPKCPKFVPSIVIVTSGLPAATVDGEIEEIDGVGVGGGGVNATWKGTEPEVATRMPSIPSQISTRTLAVTAAVRRDAGTIAVSCELLTKVVNKSVSRPPCDQSTLQ